jgi:hypothetical protein
MPNEANKRSAVPDIVHDVALLALAWRERTSRTGWTSWFVAARNLIQFFQGGGQDDDVQAEHYVADPETWRRIVASACEGIDLGEWRRASNKLASHLTYSRGRYRTVGAPEPSLGLTECLQGLWERFLENIPDEHRAWFTTEGWERTGLPAGGNEGSEE